MPLHEPHPLQIERALTRPQTSTGLSQQHRQLALTARRTHMLKDHIPPGPTLRDLNPWYYPADPGTSARTPQADTTDPGVCHHDHDQAPDQHLYRQP